MNELNQYKVTNEDRLCELRKNFETVAKELAERECLEHAFATLDGAFDHVPEPVIQAILDMPIEDFQRMARAGIRVVFDENWTLEAFRAKLGGGAQ